MIELLKELCAIESVAGCEGPIRDCIIKKAEALGAEVRVDNIGNVLAFKKGKSPRKAPVMLSTQMDEAGFKVHAIRDDGTALIEAAGYVDPVCWLGTRVSVGEKHIPGVLAMFCLERRKSETALPDFPRLLMDVGPITKSSAQEYVKVGDGVVLSSEWRDMPNGLIKGRAFDARIGCAVFLKLMEEELPYDTWFAFTSRDSIKLRGTGRGSQVAMRNVEPKAVAFVESRDAFDFSEVPESQRFLTLGKGCGVVIAESGSTYTRPLRRLLTEKADEKGIKWQIPTAQMSERPTSREASNAAGAAASVCLAAPVRYLATANPVAAKAEIEALRDMH